MLAIGPGLFKMLSSVVGRVSALQSAISAANAQIVLGDIAIIEMKVHSWMIGEVRWVCESGLGGFLNCDTR